MYLINVYIHITIILKTYITAIILKSFPSCLTISFFHPWTQTTTDLVSLARDWFYINDFSRIYYNEIVQHVPICDFHSYIMILKVVYSVWLLLIKLLWISAYKLFLADIFIFIEQIPRNEIVRSYGKCMSNFIRKWWFSKVAVSLTISVGVFSYHILPTLGITDLLILAILIDI